MFMVYKFYDIDNEMIVIPIGMYTDFQNALTDLKNTLRKFNYSYDDSQNIYENDTYFFTKIERYNDEIIYNDLSFEIILKSSECNLLIPPDVSFKMNELQLSA